MKMKKKTKRFIGFFLAISCIASCFSACVNYQEHTTTSSSEETNNNGHQFDRLTRAEPYSTVAIPVRENDPYAELVKNRYETLAQAVDAEEILNENFYALYDIDGDGIKELFFNIHYLRWGYDELSPRKSEEEISIPDRVYTVQSGNVVEVTAPIYGLWNYFAESMGGREILTNGIIRCYGGTPDFTSYAYFRYMNGKLEFLYALRYFADTGRWLFTYEGDQCIRTPLTEEEFNRLRAEIEGDAQVVEIDWKPLESYGRE